jgi:thymidine kinase
MAIRTYTVRQILDRKIKKMDLDGIWLEMFGEPESGGKVWIIYGAEKNGKTWFAMLFAFYLSLKEPVLYVSAEEGLGASFQEVIDRANFDTKNKKFKAYGYMSLAEMKEYLSRKYSPKKVFIDNVTFYQEELKNGGLQDLVSANPDKTFIFLAHEDRGEPYTSQAKMIKRMADRIIRVQGLVATVGGRVKGGQYIIDQEKAMLLNGSNIIENQ